MSTAVSRSRSSHSVPYGRRWRTVVTRVGAVTSESDDDPFGHSRPRLIGESESPSIWMIFPSFVYTSCPQPTAQNGQIDLVTASASRVRACQFSVPADRAAVPRPNGSSPVSCR